MFKKIIEKIIIAPDAEYLDILSGTVDQVFQQNKITWQEHEILLDLICKVSNGDFTRAGVVEYKKEV